MVNSLVSEKHVNMDSKSMVPAESLSGQRGDKKTKRRKKKVLKKPGKQTNKDGEEIILKNILDLGGDKSDLSLMADVDDEAEVLDEREDLDVEPIKKDEIRNFIKNLGIRKHRPTEPGEEEARAKEKEKPVKLVSMAVEEPDETKTDKKSKPNRKERKNKFKVQDAEISSTTDSQPAEPSSEHVLAARLRNYKTRKYSLVKTEGSWYEQQVVTSSPSNQQMSDSLIQQMEEFASKLLADEVSLYKSQREQFKKSETSWIKTVLTSGTLGDKMAALTLLVQDSPVHNLFSLDSLVAMAAKKGKRECILAVDTLKELFQSELIPTNRKLRTFRQSSFWSLSTIDSGDRDLFDRTLLLWHFESQFKERYLSFIKALEVLSFDTLLATKQKALSAIFNLLVNKPEQEKMLLSMLVNKVGDPDHKMASKASYLLSCLVDRHPNMKSVVVRETEQLLYRPNISVKAQYYSICFLNQLTLSHSEKDLANRLIDVYFSFFKAFVKKGEVDSKIMSALLTGVNRVYPYAKVDYELVSAQMNTLYQIVHAVNFNTSLQALMLLYQVMDASQSVSDRYYVALYRKLMDPALKVSSKQTMFLNLLFKSLRQDISDKRVKAFIKRLLQVCSYQAPQFICAALILLSEVMRGRQTDLQVMNSAGKWADDEEEERFVDVQEETSDLDVNVQLETDNVKQGTHTNRGGDSRKTSVVTTESSRQGDTSGTDRGAGEREATQVVPSSSARSSWDHRSNLGEKTGVYKPQHRNPLYCCVDQECAWELEKLSAHYHPSVALFATTVLQGNPINYSGDPLHDFAIIRFLDRFLFKNPKKQRAAEVKTQKGRFGRDHMARGVKRIPVNSEEYILREEATIPAEEKFFYKYFKQRAGQKAATADQEADDGSDAESVSDDEFDAFLDGFEAHVDEGGPDVEFDFAGEFGKQSRPGKKRGKKEESSDDDSEDAEGLSDEEIAFDDDDDFKSAFLSDEEMAGGGVDFDEEEVAFPDDDNDLAKFEARPKASKRKGSNKKGEDTTVKKKKSKQSDSSGLFAAAEEFSHILDENAGIKSNQGTAQALSNKDNAHAKQLNWEMARDRWVRGADSDWRSKKGGNKGWSKSAKQKTKKRRKPTKKH